MSLIVWSLIVVITIKYMAYVLRADNRGEGGILALTALACPKALKTPKTAWILSIGLFGAALLYGDGVITPAISVLSAVEGLKLAAPSLQNFVVPITCLILIALFWVQKKGTASIGSVFGPIICLWFSTIGILGAVAIFKNPAVLNALNPMYALQVFSEHGYRGFLVLGSVFLVATGGEALYADMGHFGRRPIRLAWLAIALPGLVLNYFGQGALMLQDPSSASNPFYLLAPQWALIPMVILSTAATVIASQALISGVFSLTQQAIQLGYCPRLEIVHTSSDTMGQVYLPQMNWALLISTLWLVLTFKSSSSLAAAYGISVSSTMVITSILMFVVSRKLWNWPLWLAGSCLAFFMVFDLAFWSANMIKVEEGGWLPLLMGLAVYILMTTWREGRKILADRMRKASPPLTEFINSCVRAKTHRVPGIAMFMVGDPQTTPPAMVHNVQHNKVLHEKIVILTVLTREIPTVLERDRIQYEEMGHGFFKIVASYGFMDSPDVREILLCAERAGLNLPMSEVTFFLGRETLIATAHPGMAIWREKLFAFMSRNSERATTFFKLPVEQVIEVGIQVEL